MVVEKEIGTGDSAVRQTVQDMCRLAGRDALHPRMIELAKTLRAGKTPREAVKAAHQYVVHAIPYKSDPEGIEQIAAPIYTTKLVQPSRAIRKYWKGGGDCDDQATALGGILMAMGFRVKMKTIAWRVHDFTHVYLVAILPDGTEIPCDPVMGRDGFNNEKRPVIRAEETECMIQRTLEDNLSGCGCGGKCGGCKSKRGGCCPQNAAHNHAPVNVIVNSGKISADSNTRAQISAELNRRLRGGGGGYTREVVREKPIIQRDVRLYNRTILPQVTAKMPTVVLPRPELSVNSTIAPPPYVKKKWPKSPEFY